MSSPRAAATKAVHKAAHKTARKEAAHKTAPTPKSARKTAAKAVTRPAGAPADASAQAIGLATAIEASLADGDIHALTPQALQALLGAACKAYAAQVEAGHPLAALAQRTSVSPTEVMVTASGLLRAANLAVFELGMWQSWTGR
jgi:hypothetical protein